MELSFLLDTNVVIQFEEVGSDRQIKGPFQQLHKLLVENSLPFNYHPLTEVELQNDKDQARLGEMLSRVKKYPKIDNPPTSDGPELEKLFGGIKSSNDLIDCQLLYAIKRNCATYLISEDAGLARRVAGTDLEDRVLFVADAIHLITRRFKPESSPATRFAKFIFAIRKSRKCRQVPSYTFIDRRRSSTSEQEVLWSARGGSPIWKAWRPPLANARSIRLNKFGK